MVTVKWFGGNLRRWHKKRLGVESSLFAYQYLGITKAKTK
jgi:hypothetical protein